MAGYENSNSYFLPTDSFTRGDDVVKIARSFYEKYKLESIGIAFDVVHDEGAASPVVLWDRDQEKIYTLIDLNTRVWKNKHQEDLASLAGQLVSNVERPLILSTLDPQDERIFLQAVCATRRSQDPALQAAWAAVDAQYPDATTLGKARHITHTLHAEPAMLHDSLYAAGGVWQRIMQHEPPGLNMTELQNFIADRAARLQTFDISRADTPRHTPVRPTLALDKVATPRNLQYHALRYLSLDDFPPSAHTAIHNTVNQALNPLPQVTNGSYEGIIQTHGEYFVQHTVHGTVFHRTADVEGRLPQGINTAQRFAVSYAKGTMTVQALGQERSLPKPQEKQPKSQRKAIPCCTIA